MVKKDTTTVINGWLMLKQIVIINKKDHRHFMINGWKIIEVDYVIQRIRGDKLNHQLEYDLMNKD